MIATLIKHEWIRTRGLVAAVTGLAALVTVAGTALTATGWPVLSIVGFTAAAIAILALVPTMQLALAADYWKSSYARTGYFTQSLPIRGSRIFAVKLTWSALMTLAALVATLLLLAVFSLGASSQFGTEPNPLVTLRDGWVLLTEVAAPWMVAAGVLMVLAFYLIWPVQYYFSISVGHELRLSRLGSAGPFLVFVGLYVVSQLTLVLGMIAVPFGVGMPNGQLGVVSFNFFTTMRLGDGAEDVMPIGFLPPLVVVIGICLWRTVRSWNHRVSLT